MQLTWTCSWPTLTVSGSGLLVLRPDVLLSGTRVAGSFKCGRQALLEERFGGCSGRKAMEGTLLHSLFEARPNPMHKDMASCPQA